MKNTSGFSVLVSDVVFPILSYLGSGSREMPKLLSGMRDKLNVMVGDHTS